MLFYQTAQPSWLAVFYHQKALCCYKSLNFPHEIKHDAQEKQITGTMANKLWFLLYCRLTDYEVKVS